MKNKYELKKCLSKIGLSIIVLIVGFIFIRQIEYQRYTSNFNNKTQAIVGIIKQKYPNVTYNEIIEVLSNEETINSDFLKNYSIDIKKDMALKQNYKDNKIFSVINITYMFISMLFIVIIFLKYNKRKDKSIQDVTKYIEQINKKNYKLDLDGMSEDELSILKNEIYKTTVMLKEQVEISLNDKIKLKDSLSDISHQLKTPLTSIMIMLDNLIDNPDMQKDIREDFIKDIKIEITNINFLVQAILKLSKFDSNTVEYNNKKVKVSQLISKTVKKLLPLCDLKNVRVNVKIEQDDILLCDEMWQIEALSNVIKNCIEHSNCGNNVDVIVGANKIYTYIKVIDYGSGISKEELPHVFEKFYKGKNSSKDSIGIGLALSKTIIEKNNGKIYIDSKINEGTSFIIKYIK